MQIDQPSYNNNGGEITFGPDGYLYVGLGDGGFSTPQNASQELSTRLGKILRIDVDSGDPYSVPAGNPFAAKGGTPQDEIWAVGRHHSWPAEPSGPDPQAIEEAVEALALASKAVIICGGGVVASGAASHLRQLAAMLDIPVATTVSGQGAIAETDDYALGVVGSNGGVPSTRAVVDQADLVVFISCRAGSVTTERWRSPRPGTRIVHIDSDPEVVGANYPTDVAIVADARLALSALVDALAERAVSGSSGGMAKAKAAWDAKQAEFRPLAESAETPICPERVVATLQKVLDDDAIICADPGTPCPYFSAHYRWPIAGRNFITNRAHGALGYALGASMGAHTGRPGVKTVSVMGDGSFGMAVGELETVLRYRMPITFITLSNSVFGWIKAGQRSGFGERFHNVDFTRTDHAAVAAAYGMKSWRVENPDDLESVLKQAVESSEPNLVDIITQPLDEAVHPFRNGWPDDRSQ